MVKKIITIFIILLAGMLSIYIYSRIDERRAARPLDEQKPGEKKETTVAAKDPSGIVDKLSAPAIEREKIIPVTKAAEGVSEDAFHEKEAGIKTQGQQEAAPVESGIKEKAEQRSTFTAEAPPREIKRKEEPKPAAKKELIITEEPSGSADKIAAGDERRAARPLDEQKTGEKKETTVAAKSPSGVMDKPSAPDTETKNVLPVTKAAEGVSEDAFHEKEAGIKTQGQQEAAPVESGIKEKAEQRSTFTAEAPPKGIKRKEEPQPAAEKELIITEVPSGSADKITPAVPVVEEIKPVDKPDIITEEQKAAIVREEIKPPIEKMALAAEETRSVEEKSVTFPGGGLMIMPAEAPVPSLIEQLSVQTKDTMPDGTEKLSSAKMETAVAVSRMEKAADTEEIVSPAGKAEMYTEKPETSPGEMFIEGNNKRIVIFPFQNLSDDRDAYQHVLPLLIRGLQQRGFEVVDGDDLVNFLCNERVRSTGYISRELSGKIRKRFNVSTILTGAIVSFSTEEIPEFGIVARMIDSSDATILWANYSAATGEDFIAILELGRLKSVFSLMPKVMDILFASLKAEDLNQETKALHRIAVMPFKNNTDFNNAGTIVTYMFIVEMLKSRQFIPIEYGDTRDVIIKQGIRLKGDIGYENIGALSTELKARGIVVGVVDNYSDGAAVSAAPNVGITARLIDGSNKKIMWYNSYQLSGEDNIIALDWGRVRSVHTVAYKAVSGLVKEMSRKKWRD